MVRRRGGAKIDEGFVVLAGVAGPLTCARPPPPPARPRPGPPRQLRGCCRIGSVCPRARTTMNNNGIRQGTPADINNVRAHAGGVCVSAATSSAGSCLAGMLPAQRVERGTHTSRRPSRMQECRQRRSPLRPRSAAIPRPALVERARCRTHRTASFARRTRRPRVRWLTD
jgi:hypothetical protein